MHRIRVNAFPQAACARAQSVVDELSDKKRKSRLQGTQFEGSSATSQSPAQDPNRCVDGMRSASRQG